MKKLFLIGLIILFSSLAYAVDYSTNRLDYYFDGVDYLADGLTTDDIAIDGNSPSSGQSINDYGWDGTKGLYTNAQASLGSLSIGCLENGGDCVDMQIDIEDASFIGEIGYKVRADVTTTYCSNALRNYADTETVEAGSTDAGTFDSCLLAASSISWGTIWHNVTYIVNSSGAYSFVDNTSCNIDESWSGVKYWATYDTRDGCYYDEFWVANGTRPLGSTLVFENPTPPDGARNNTQVVINISCSTGDITLWFDANANPITKVLDGTTSPDDYTTSVSEGTYYYKGSCNSGTTNSSIRSWTFDETKPTVDLLNNFFNANNYSMQPQYLDTIDINMTLTDDNLFGFLFNMTNLSKVLFNYTTEGLSGATWNFNTTINISEWEEDVYNITIMASDSHTTNSIEDYEVTTRDKEIVFNTVEGNRITIKSDLTGSTNYKKLTDRYSFSYDFGAVLTPQKIFTITADKKITYLPKSIYTAHFVVWNNEKKEGNWIDFEGGGIPTIKRINDYEYTVTFSSLSNQITFNSIGGLNVLTKDFRWYRGLINLSESSNLPTYPTNITLNITNHTSIKNISAELLYDGVTYNPVKTGYPNYIIFRQNLTSATNDIIYYWNITVKQDGGNVTSFLKSREHDILTINIDNCTDNNVVGLNFTIYGEDSLDIIDVNITGVFEYWPSENPEFVQNFTIDFESINGFQICISHNISYTTNAYFQHVGDGIVKERYYLEGAILNSTIRYVNIYNFESADVANGLPSELKAIVKNNIYTPLANIIIKMQRFYPSENLWRTVQIDKSDEFGKGVFYVYQNDKDYKFLFESGGVLLDTTQSVKFICDSTTECEQTFIIYDITGAEAFIGMYGDISYDTVNKLVTLTWNDPDNTASRVRFLVEKQATDKVITICNTESTSASGSIVCNVSLYSGFITARGFRGASPDVTWLIELIEIATTRLSDIIGSNEGMMLSSFLMMTLIGFGAATGSGIVVVLMGSASLVFLYLFELNSIINMTLIISGVSLGIITLFMMRDR